VRSSASETSFPITVPLSGGVYQDDYLTTEVCVMTDRWTGEGVVPWPIFMMSSRLTFPGSTIHTSVKT